MSSYRDETISRDPEAHKRLDTVERDVAGVRERLKERVVYAPSDKLATYTVLGVVAMICFTILAGMVICRVFGG